MNEIEARSKIKYRIEVAREIAGNGVDGKAFEDLEIALQVMKEIREYREIGTVEEFKALKEKSVAKKPEPIDYEKYMDVLENAEFLRGAYWCPNCNHTVRSGAYCDDCGQSLDWE